MTTTARTLHGSTLVVCGIVCLEADVERCGEDLVRAADTEVSRRRRRRSGHGRHEIEVAEVARTEPVAPRREARAAVQPDMAKRRLIERQRARGRGRAVVEGACR